MDFLIKGKNSILLTGIRSSKATQFLSNKLRFKTLIEIGFAGNRKHLIIQTSKRKLGNVVQIFKLDIRQPFKWIFQLPIEHLLNTDNTNSEQF
jgi:hypothetical protein